MNNSQYEALIRQATKGDKESLRELFALGERLLTDGNLDEAVKIFRESAISYRIEAFRNAALREEAEFREKRRLSDIEIYREWLSRQAPIFEQLPRSAEGITKEFIRNIMREEIWKDDSLLPLLAFIINSLSKCGMEFFSPGGSEMRRVGDQVKIYLGLGDIHESYLHHPDVRIGVELLADEIIKRYSLKLDGQSS